MNQVILIGRLTFKEVSYTVKGTALAKFTLNIDKKQGPQFIKLSAFGRAAEAINSSIVGSTLVCRGEIDSRKYISKTDGKEKEFQDVSIFQVVDGKDAFPDASSHAGGTVFTENDIAF